MESCTGGLLSSTITSIPGAGDCFVGGLVAYATEAKKLVGVDPDIVDTHGAVSRKTAEAMAGAAKDKLKADIGIGVTGVAGPETQEGVPVGMVFIAVEGGSPPAWRSNLYHFFGGPEEIKQQAVNEALLLLQSVTAEVSA
jgi:PncC family amidohydrolase